MWLKFKKYKRSMFLLSFYLVFCLFILTRQSGFFLRELQALPDPPFSSLSYG